MRKKPLDEQVILVTGASYGVGRAVAREAGRRGAAVVLTGRTRQALQSPEINTLVALMRSDDVQAKLTALAEPFTVERVTLYRSHLSHEGASHEVLASARLP